MELLRPNAIDIQKEEVRKKFGNGNRVFAGEIRQRPEDKVPFVRAPWFDGDGDLHRGFLISDQMIT
jgi:hypothetical protein